jgi:hypothetical protein
MGLVDNKSLPVVPYIDQGQWHPYMQKKLNERMNNVMDSFSAYMRFNEENKYLNTYKALHLGGKKNA